MTCYSIYLVNCAELGLLDLLKMPDKVFSLETYFTLKWVLPSDDGPSSLHKPSVLLVSPKIT